MAPSDTTPLGLDGQEARAKLEFGHGSRPLHFRQLIEIVGADIHPGGVTGEAPQGPMSSPQTGPQHKRRQMIAFVQPASKDRASGLRLRRAWRSCYPPPA